tara:strand:- start:14 stop:547 length:534 start_codon:yes stop_codon:yes gene_type:complete
MSKYLEVNEDFVKSLMKQAAWDKVKVVVEQEAEESVEEDTTIEEHTCPLCSTTLEEELSDEALLEHLEKISNLLSEDSVEEEAEEDIDEEAIDEEDVDEVTRTAGPYGRDADYDPEGKPTPSHVAQNPDTDPDKLRLKDSKKSKLKKKVASLKKKWTGQKKGDKSKTHKGKDFEKKA